MELEPITRKEKIIAGENLEPITRLEKFLKEYGGSGGSGGGGSSDAVLYTPQTLTDAQKKQARDNIEASIADFVVNGTLNSDSTVTLDKTFAQIQAAIQEGKRPVLKAASDVGIFSMPLVAAGENVFVFAVTAPSGDYGNITFVMLLSSGVAVGGKSNFPTFNSDGSMPQMPMAADPSSDMEIATKKYVDDKECILKSTTPGSTKKFKITVDDSGNISTTEVI